MPLPLIAAIRAAPLATKVAGFVGKWWVKAIAMLLAVAALIWAAHTLVNEFQKHEEALYQSGVTAGTLGERAVWQKASARNAIAQRDYVVQQAKNQSQAVQNYLNDKAATEPQVIRVKEETIRYAQTAAGSDRCLDDRGVQILLDGRASLGLVGPTGPGALTSGGVRYDLRGANPAPVQH